MTFVNPKHTDDQLASCNMLRKWTQKKIISMIFFIFFGHENHEMVCVIVIFELNIIHSHVFGPTSTATQIGDLIIHLLPLRN
jgi:hypothetical protein